MAALAAGEIGGGSAGAWFGGGDEGAEEGGAVGASGFLVVAPEDGTGLSGGTVLHGGQEFKKGGQPNTLRTIWLVLIVQNILAQMVAVPFTNWNDMAFKIY